MNHFMQKDYDYDGRQLNCKIIKKKADYLHYLMDYFKEPRKVFINCIPQFVGKKEVAERLSDFGEIEEQTYVAKDNQSYNYSFVVFVSHEAAKKCVDQKKIHIEANCYIRASYAKIKVSKNLLKKIKNDSLKDYIEGVVLENVKQDPVKFRQQYQDAYGDNLVNPLVKTFAGLTKLAETTERTTPFKDTKNPLKLDADDKSCDGDLTANEYPVEVKNPQKSEKLPKNKGDNKKVEKLIRDHEDKKLKQKKEKTHKEWSEDQNRFSKHADKIPKPQGLSKTISADDLKKRDTQNNEETVIAYCPHTPNDLDYNESYQSNSGYYNQFDGSYASYIIPNRQNSYQSNYNDNTFYAHNHLNNGYHNNYSTAYDNNYIVNNDGKYSYSKPIGYNYSPQTQNYNYSNTNPYHNNWVSDITNYDIPYQNNESSMNFIRNNGNDANLEYPSQVYNSGKLTNFYSESYAPNSNSRYADADGLSKALQNNQNTGYYNQNTNTQYQTDYYSNQQPSLYQHVSGISYNDNPHTSQNGNYVYDQEQIYKNNERPNNQVNDQPPSHKICLENQELDSAYKLSPEQAVHHVQNMETSKNEKYPVDPKKTKI